MAKPASNRRVSAEADAPVAAVTGEADPPVEPESQSASPDDVQLPQAVQRFDPTPPTDVSSNIVTVVPTSNAVVTVPSGASFQLMPGVAVQMQKRDADFLSESGLA